jgi:magnesium chelatase subunit H
MNVTVFYVGSSLLAPLSQAEREINRQYALDLRVAAYNCGAPLDDDEWQAAERDLARADLVFIIHVTDSENAARIIRALDHHPARAHAVIAINCMPDLMRRTHLGKLDFSRMARKQAKDEEEQDDHHVASSKNLVRKLGSWMAGYVRPSKNSGAGLKTGQYLRFIERLPALLKYVPSAGKLGDIKHYLYLFCYFLQPTPGNIQMMLLYAIKHYVPGCERGITCRPPETRAAVAIYHPDATGLFESFEVYRKWYERTRQRRLDPQQTIGLLLMRPQIISGARRHYDALIRAIEAEGLAVIPATSTFMDNREACRKFFVEERDGIRNNNRQRTTDNGQLTPRVSQVLSLTGFSFVGGPAMNDSQASVAFLRKLNVPFHSAVSLDVQTIESWASSPMGLNPVQTGMQVAIPEIDGATEPFIFGGMTASGDQPEPIEDRCRRLARRLVRWNRLRAAPRRDLRLAILLFCFPPNKGNIGTAAELDVFPSVWEVLRRLQADGYVVEAPESADALRERLLGGNSSEFGMVANVCYRMDVDEYRRLCPYVDEIEAEWGSAPGSINAFGREMLIPGIQMGNVFVGVQPTFGYEGDPMRLLMAKSGAPHHGFMGLYTYLEKVFRADVVIHVGTHGALEFMPGKQMGLSARCWPDRLIGELPNLYLYSVNNPSEGTIAKRRSYAELISYLTPPIESAGLYRELAELKELLTAYRQARSEAEREQLYAAIEEQAERLHFTPQAQARASEMEARAAQARR